MTDQPRDQYRTWGRSRAVRLPGDNRGPGIVAVTIVTSQRRNVLAPPRDVAGALDEDLGRCSADGHVKVLLAMFMPDHVHLMLQLDGSGKPLSHYVNQWKGRWSRRLAKPGEKPFWQRSFYDHWMRRGEDQEYARYIAANPVRWGLAAAWNEFPFVRAYVPLM